MHLVIFGLGYTGTAIAAAAVGRGLRVTGTSRDPARVQAPPGVTVVAFDQAGPAIATATHVLQTAPPSPDGDPALLAHGPALDAAPLQWLGYLSTTGVYGDRQGGWVDETTAPAPTAARSARRLLAEQAWRDAAGGRPLDLFRVAGIYGPGRSPFDDLRAGTARRINKPGHKFGRIHRDDITAAVLAGLQHPDGVRVCNLTDDEPAASADVVAEAARLLQLPVPPLVPYDPAALNEMARSFWAESRQVRSVLTQQALGLRWNYPTYREGLAAILDQERADQERADQA